ncbi:sodium-dependent transporter [Rhodobacteraceae bacterium RKSG542]|uniref:sodium-dependent transporter n=1 Tax=Pseudovibrio flavus TaxID=2529854 RepID=UPI0012BCA340|nr:sodium-dependent transporter [Pseudovibrio flavus]MTI16187.1 sodium-dependent transporter [Pseudovibrio flavus]
MQREQWGSRFGFIMAAAGSAVGLGNIWKFPYLAGTEGGGAFVALYLIIMATMGVALIMTEIALGRRAKANPVGTFLKLGGKRWTGVGILAVFTGTIILSYYSVVGGWTIAYLVKSIFGTLSAAPEELGTQFGGLVGGVAEPIIYTAAFLGLTTAIVVAGVTDGIERSVKFLMPLLFILLMILVIRSVTLPGAMEGVKFFLQPNWADVDVGMVGAALGMAFFSLSLGMGAMITYGSYLNPEANIPNASWWVVTLACLVALLGGLLVLPAVFAFGMDPGAGPGLTFITLPAVFGEMFAGWFFQILFFAMLLIAALTSSISLLAIPVAFFAEQYGVSRRVTAAGAFIVIFLLAIPCSLSLGAMPELKVMGFTFFDFLSETVDRLLMPLGGALTAVFAGWFLFGKLSEELTNNGTIPCAYLGAVKVLLRYAAPLGIGYIMYNSLIG